MRRFKDIGNGICLAFFDSLAFLLSLGLAFSTRKVMGTVLQEVVFHGDTFAQKLVSWWWMPPIFIAFIAWEKLYFKRLSFWDETKLLIKAVTISVLVIFALTSMGKMSDQISRLTLVFLWWYGLFVFPLFRFLAKKLLSRICVWQEDIIIIGAGNVGVAAAKEITRDSHLGYRVVGFLDDREELMGRNVQVGEMSYKIFGKTKHFKKFVNLLNISTVMIAIPSLDRERLCEITNNVQRFAKNLLLVPDLKGVALINAELNHFFMEEMFVLKINNNLKSRYNRMLKSAFDVVVAILFLPLILLLIAIIGLIIRIDSPGPVIFTHERVGQGGRTVGVYKFRSMYRDSAERLTRILKSDEAARAEWGATFKLKNDPRITRVGRFLRKTSLDELPQIFNVIKGDMSLVGPRPVVQEEIEKYYGRHAEYYHLVKPGMTGLWQVSGRNDTGYDYRVNLDKWYVLNWSVWLDTVLLLKTVKVVLKRDGAY